MSKRILILGSAHPLRGGGIATFNERLAKAFMDKEDEVIIVSFSLQYPKILFPGKSQLTDEKAPENLKIVSWLNSINPFNWINTARKIKKWSPDIMIVRYWIPFMGPCLGTVSRLVRKNKKTKVIAIVDNAIPHEKRPGDTLFTKWFTASVDAFVTMSKQVLKDLDTFNKTKPRVFSLHPLYDNFGEIISKSEACKKLNLSENQTYLLFFGFIRDYKGLDWLLKAIADEEIKKRSFKLIVAGEYYSNKEIYESLVQELGLSDHLIMNTEFIANEDVKHYFSVADLIVQPYKSATQSGVTQVAYHFEKPILTTNVGGLAEIVLDGKTGIIVEPNVESIRAGILRFLDNPNIEEYQKEIRKEKQKYSWDVFIENILNLSNEIK
ncbi:MAG: glycosyltransferase [Bacteroidales bacterium]|nr:glycosyltransferase [Bacteroidales bacterium]